MAEREKIGTSQLTITKFI